MHAKLLQSCPTLWTLWTSACQARNSPGKSAGVGYHALLQEIFLTQESNPGPLRLLHRRQILHHGVTRGAPLVSAAAAAAAAAAAKSLQSCPTLCDP